MDFFNQFFGQGNQQNNFYQNANQINDHQQNKNTNEFSVFDLIYNIARHNDDLLENVKVNEYCMFVFFQKTANDLYICSEAKTFKFNLKEKNTIEIELGNEQINGLKLYIKQKDPTNDYINYLFGDKYHVDISILENFKFVCLDGKFVNGKLDRIEYTKHTKSTESTESTESQDKTVCIVRMNQNIYIDPEKYDGLWQDLISKRRRSIENKELNSKVENKVITIGEKKYGFTIDDSNLLNKKDILYLDLGHVLLNLQESGRSVIRNFEEESITVVCFVRSILFKNNEWQYDFKQVKNIFFSDNRFYESAYGPKKNETPIVTNGLKIFILSGDFSREFIESNFDSLYNKEKMQFLRDNGFSELELHELKLHELGSRDNSKSKEIKKILLLTADFSEKNEIKDISKSLICQFTKLDYEILPSEYWPSGSKKERLAKLAAKAVIVPSTPKIVYSAEVDVDKASLYDFLKKNLDGFSNLSSLGLVIKLNGKEDKLQKTEFINQCSNQKLETVTIKSPEDIVNFWIKIYLQKNGLSDSNISSINDNFTDYDFNDDGFIPEKYCSENIKKSNSVELVLGKYGDQGVAFFYENKKYENKKTDIKVEMNKFNRDEEKIQLVVKKNRDVILGAFIRRRDQWTLDELLTKNVIIENNEKLMFKKEQLSERGKEEFGVRSITDKMNKAKQKSKEEEDSQPKNYINEEYENEKYYINE